MTRYTHHLTCDDINPVPNPSLNHLPVPHPTLPYFNLRRTTQSTRTQGARGLPLTYLTLTLPYPTLPYFNLPYPCLTFAGQPRVRPAADPDLPALHVVPHTSGQVHGHGVCCGAGARPPARGGPLA